MRICNRNHFFRHLPVCLAFISLLLGHTVYAQLHEIDFNYKPAPLGKHLSYYQDHSRHLTLQRVIELAREMQFIPCKDEVPSLGKGDFALWIRLEVRNTTPETLRYLELAFPTLDSLFIYYQEDQQWKYKFLGDVVPFEQREFHHRNFVISLNLTENEISTIYLRILSRGSLIFPLEIHTIESLHNKHVKEDLLFGLFFGIMGVMLFYNLFLSVSVRSYSYLFYVLIILGNLLTISALNGHAFQYIWYNWPWMGNAVIPLGMGLWIASSNLFARRFLDAPRHSTFYNYIFIILIANGLLLMLLSLTINYKWSLWFGNILLAINCLSLFISGIVFWARKVQIAKLFTIAWTLYLLGVILYNFRNLGLLPANFFTTHILEIGAITEVLMLSIALGFKYRNLEVERRVAKNMAIEALAENKRIVEFQNEELERNIKERTQELFKQKEEILKKNELLESKNYKLSEAYDIIEKQNNILQEYTENLEQQVGQRTAELSKTNRELAENVQKLEQYAYITAHNLRSPVARLLGLTQLLQMQPEQILDPETTDILDKIKHSGKELDTIIRDMNTILEMKHQANDELSVVNFEERIINCLEILREPIANTQTTIAFDFSEAPKIKTHVVFLDSILYNLISNAIKYRSPERVPQISISTHKQRKGIVLKVSDNGLGMDLGAYKKQVFGMYKRFHSHVEGKGLGLYLVKSQVEMAGGSIEVESTLNQGTTFFVTLKDVR